MFSTWEHCFALLGLLNYVLCAGSGPLHTPLWDLVSIFNVFMIPTVLISVWTRTFQARAAKVSGLLRPARD